MARIETLERGGYAVLRLFGDEGLHRLELSTLEILARRVESWESSPDVAAVVVTGVPEPSFAVGANIRELGMITPSTAPEYAARGQSVFSRMRRAPQVYIAAIDGHCLGGGLDLALACDVRYASERSRFAHPGARLGIITGFAGTSRLPQAVGLSAAVRMFASGDALTGAEARALGLVERLFSPEDLVAQACALAERIAAAPRGLSASAKELAYATRRMPREQARVYESRLWELWEAGENDER